jgi:hypothetical protein
MSPSPQTGLTPRFAHKTAFPVCLLQPRSPVRRTGVHSCLCTQIYAASLRFNEMIRSFPVFATLSEIRILSLGAK